MESTVVDSLRHFCGRSLPTLSVFSASTSSRDRSPGDYFTFRSTGGLIYLPFISLFFAYTCFWKPLSLKGQLFLLIIFRSLYHGEEQEGIHSPVHFHILNLISGSRSYFPRRAQFTISPEAWGRGPSRRRWILLALSLLGQINALCDIWRTLSIPLAEWWKTLPGRLTMCTEVNGVWGGDISYL